jgi:hypothetical protein
MEEKVIETYHVGGVTYELLHAQKFLWDSKIKNADGSPKYAGRLPLDKESLKALPEVVQEIAKFSPDFIRVKTEDTTSRGLEPKIIPLPKPKE